MALKLPETIINSFDINLSLSRIKNDLQSDFIYAPHLSAVYLLARDELAAGLVAKLKDGTFEPTLPITIEVPKASGFTRPGSILLPYERLAYQVVVDSLATTADGHLDRTSVFSNQLLENDTDGFMFRPTGDCYTAYKNAVKEHCRSEDFSFVLQADVVSHFQNLNQHNLINLLSSSECDADTVKFLEKLLSTFTEKNSRGVIQGVSPSDFLGNFSLCSIDGQLSISEFTFARYVDDISIFLPTEHDCKIAKVKLSQWLRKEGLDLNERKTSILPIATFLQEETITERMFDEAKTEMEEEFGRNDFYHSTISWDFDWDFDPADEEEILDTEVIIEATRLLFDQEADEKTRDKIDKYCISAFIAASDTHAINSVLQRYIEKPHLAQIYAKYLQKMISEELIQVNQVERLIQQPNIIFDYQYLWLYAALMSVEDNIGNINVDTVNVAIHQFGDANFSPSLRAVNAIFIAKFGTPVQKRLVKDSYAQEQSEYVRAAILYATRYLTTAERITCYRAWGGHSELNSLVVIAARRAPVA